MSKLQAISIWLDLQSKFPGMIITIHQLGNRDWYVKVQKPEYRGVVTIYHLWQPSDLEQCLNSKQLIPA